MLLFSATTPSWVLDIARRYLKNPINVDAVGAGTRGATTIRHLAVKVPDNYLARKNILEDVIAAHSNGGKVIVFTQVRQQQHAMAEYADHWRSSGWEAAHALYNAARRIPFLTPHLSWWSCPPSSSWW